MVDHDEPQGKEKLAETLEKNETDALAQSLKEHYQESGFDYGVRFLDIIQEWYHQHLFEQRFKNGIN